MDEIDPASWHSTEEVRRVPWSGVGSEWVDWEL